MQARKRSIFERIVSGALALSLACSGLLSNVSAAAAASPTLPETAISAQASEATSPTVVRELTENRTETSRSFLLSNGVIRGEYHSIPIHYRDAATNSMKPIDITLQDTTVDGRPVAVNRANGFKLKFPRDLEGDEVSIETSKTSVSLRPRWKNRVGAAKVTTGTMESRSVSATDRVYPEAFVGAALEYESRADGLKETIVLARPIKDNVFGFDLTLDGVTPRIEEDRSISLISVGSTETLYSIPPPYMMDSSGSTTGDDYSNGVHYEISGTGPVYHLDVVADPAWLADSARVYPVRIDPSVTTKSNTLVGGNDTFISSKNQGTNYISHTLTWINKNDPAANWTEYGYIQPHGALITDMSTMKAAGKVVVASELKLHVNTAYVAKAGSVIGQMVDTNDVVSLPSLTWTAYAGGAATALGSHPTNTIAISSGGWKYLDVTSMVAYWQGLGLPQNRCTMRLQGATTGVHVGFDPAENSTYPPVWQIDFAPTPTVSVTAPTGGNVTSVPTARWTFGETNGNPQAEWDLEVATSTAGAAIATAGASNTAASSALPVPAGGWVDGTKYYVRVRAASSPSTQVSRLWSAWVTKDFTIVPQAPTVSVTSPSGGNVTSVPAANWAYSDPLGSPQVQWQLEVATSTAGAPIATTGASNAANSSALPVPSGGWVANTKYYVRIRVASSPYAQTWWSAWVTKDFTPVPSSAVIAPSFTTTSSASWFYEYDTDADGINDLKDDVADQGRGSVALSWSAATGATGYNVYLFDGYAYRKIGSTTATSWSTAGKQIYPSDTQIAGLAANTTANPFLSGTGLDLRDDPRPLYAKTAGTSVESTTSYAFVVTPYNSIGETPLASNTVKWVTLADRTTSMSDVAAPSPVKAISVSTTSSARWFRESINASGTLLDENDTADEGRGSLEASWAPSAGASGYRVLMSDGTTEREIGRTFGSAATSFTTSGLGALPKDTTLTNWGALPSSWNPFGAAPLSSSTQQASITTTQTGTGVVVTDGTDLYVHRWSNYAGPTAWTRIESGLSTGTAGVVTGQGQVGASSGRDIMSAVYLGGYIFEGSAVTSRSIEGIHKTKTATETGRTTLSLDKPLLKRNESVDATSATGDVMIAGDDAADVLYSISHDRTLSTATFKVREYAVPTNSTGTFVADHTITLPGQTPFAYFDGAFVAEGNLYLIEWSGKSRVVRIDTRTWKATGMWTSGTGGPGNTHPISACYEPISRTVFGGWLSNGTMARFTGPGVDLRDNPSKLYAATPGATNDSNGGYLMRVVPFNSLGGEPSLGSNAGVWTTLDNRTVTVDQDPRHTIAPLGSVAGDEANARLDGRGRALTLDRTDLSIDSWGPEASLTRHYSSDDTSTGYLSPGWRFGFEQHLANASVDSTLVTYVDEDGERHPFEKKKNDVWYAPNGFVADIAFDGGNAPLLTFDDTWTLTFKDRTKLTFDSSGQLVSESDRNGQTVTYTFSECLVRITAANNQAIDVVLENGEVRSATHVIGGTPTSRSVSYGSSLTTLSVDFFPNAAEDRFTIEYGYADQRITSAEITGAVLAVGAGRWDMEYLAGGGLGRMTAPALAHSQERPEAAFSYAPDPITGSDVATITRSAVVSGSPDTQVSMRYVANPTGTTAYVTNWRTSAETESRWAYEYSLANETVREISPTGKQVSRVFDSRSNVLFEYDEERHATSYEYDARDQVTQQTDPRGCATYFEYDTSGNLVSEERELNETERARSEYEYDDPKGLLTLSRTRLSANKWIATMYSDFASSSGEPQRTEQLGQVEVAEGDFQAAPISLSTTATVASIVTTSQIDQFGQVAQQSDADGLVIMKDAVYSPAGKLKHSTDVEGVVTHNRYGALGDLIETSQTVNATSGPDFTNWRSYEVDAYGRTVRESNLGAGGVENTWMSHTFDAAGNEIATGGSIAGTSTAWFDARGEMVAQWAPDAGAATVGNIQSASRRVMNADGVELAVIAAGRPDTDATTKEWRPDGLLLKTTSPDKSWVRFEYDDGGLQTAVVSPAEDGSESIARTYYDIGGRQVRNEPDEGVITKNAYDLAGRLIKNSAVQITGDENEAGEWIETEVEATSTVNTYNELGWTLSTTGADGVRKMSSYDALGNVVEESSFASGAITPTTVVSTSYDAKKRITRQTTAEAGGDSVVAFAYDAFGRITSEKHLKGALKKKDVETAYDEFGRERLVTDSETGVTTSFVYAGGSNKKSTVRMAYGSLTTTSSTDEKGRNATQTATFDLRGGVRDLTRSLIWDRTKNLVTSARLLTDLSDSSMVYAYDSTDKLTSLTGGAWGTGGLSVSYNTTGTASKISDTVTVPWAGSNVVANRNFGYTQSGRLSTVTAGSRETLYSWNASGTGDLEGIRDGGVVTKLDYAAGHISTLTVDGQRTTFAFDAAGRRILESSPTGSIETSWTANDRQLSWTAKDSGGGTVRSAAYGYDGDGQRLTATVLAPGPWSATATQTAYSYAYDGLALRRISAGSEGASATLTYLYGSGDVPYAGSYEATASGTATSTVFQVLSTDHGDVVALADEAGDVFARYAYGPFGEVEGTSTRGTPLIPAETAAAIAQANPLRYAGYCFDSWSGDYYLQARYYDPSTRQFLSKDPAEADGEESAYQYCGGDPIQATDATGEAADYTGSGKITVANATANAARHTANKRLKRLLMQRAVEAERRERAHRAYVKKLANARIARQKAAAAKLRIAKAAAAKKKRIASLKAQVAASQREAKKLEALVSRMNLAAAMMTPGLKTAEDWHMSLSVGLHWGSATLGVNGTMSHFRLDDSHQMMRSGGGDSTAIPSGFNTFRASGPYVSGFIGPSATPPIMKGVSVVWANSRGHTKSGLSQTSPIAFGSGVDAATREPIVGTPQIGNQVGWTFVRHE